MKKILLAVSVSMFSIAGFAQKGNNQIIPAAEFGIFTGDNADVYKPAIGASVKGAYGIGTAGQATITVGLLASGAKKELVDLLDADKITSTSIPVLAGYRHHFNAFFVEPQVGYSFNKAKIKGGELESSHSDGSFSWAVGGGYAFNNKVELGLRYQSSSSDGSSVGLFVFRVGYRFSLGSK